MRNSLSGRSLCLGALLLAAGWSQVATNICRVTNTAGGGDGSTWGAPAALQTALGNVNCTEVCVAQGVYKPALPGNLSVSFSIRSGAAVYGGFAGSETQRSQRNPAVNLTVLSGDIDNNDSVDANGVDVDATHIAGSNSSHVVLMDASSVAIDATTVLDGFTVTGGSAVSNNGGGLYCFANMGHACSPTLTTLRFIGNKASFGGALFDSGAFGNTSSPTLRNVSFTGNMAGGGGAMYNEGSNFGTSSPTLNDVAFSNNVASGSGGAMYNNASLGTTKPVLNGVTFSGNSADSGGAMANFSAEPGGPSPAGNASPVLNNVTFYMNTATTNGGAMYNSSTGDGTLDHSSKSNPTMTNVTFNGNSAAYGGAIYDYGNAITTPTLSNVILWGNHASGAGPEIYNLANGGTAIATIDYSVVEGGCPTDGGGLGGNNCANDIYTDPLLGAFGDHGGPTQTLLPGQGGSAFDTGTCGLPSDQRGATRPQGNYCDIGATELVTSRVYANNFDGTVTP